MSVSQQPFALVEHTSIDLDTMAFDNDEQEVATEMVTPCLSKIAAVKQTDLVDKVSADVTLFLKGNVLLLAKLSKQLKAVGFGNLEIVHACACDKKPRTEKTRMRNQVECIVVARAGQHKNREIKEFQNFTLSARVPQLQLASLNNKLHNVQMHPCIVQRLCDHLIDERSTAPLVHAGTGLNVIPLLNNNCSVVSGFACTNTRNSRLTHSKKSKASTLLGNAAKSN